MEILKTISGAARFIAFWVAVIVQLPIIVLIPTGKLSVGYARIFWKILMKITGVKTKVSGEKLSNARPLMLVSNHISVFEFPVFQIVFGTGYFGKAEIAKMPLVGYIARKIGVVFIDRNPRTAVQTTEKINKVMACVSYPMTIFPEGTTNNGNFIYPFKTAMFDVVDKVRGITIQPVVMIYRDKNGKKLGEQEIADDYSYPDNKKIEKYNTDFGKKERLVKKERSAFGQVFHIMKMGGMIVELKVLKPFKYQGMDRKEIASALHGIINDEFMKLKDK
ncbi:MAG: 1-acyl-sn-glycerol-3-phosphate acyltransferase [Rickettsiales bacterium]|jgi:1-acyl-sn-glycerol-3-phosphate acyltransferase|nr:1-acyl-sn-glycerol-3-phosphate acyltransferase [Rickettsiales bacterium]